MNSNPKLYPTNPIGIIATFVFFIEAITASSLHLLRDHAFLLERIVYFIISFPVFIAATFFVILVFKREALFAPSDFKDEDNFVRLLSRVKTLEIDQQVSELASEPPSDLEPVMALANELIKRNEIRNAIKLGRGYLKTHKYLQALDYFNYLKGSIPDSHPLFYKVIANIAYTEIELKLYDNALKNLNTVENQLGEKLEVWQLAALAIVHHRLGNQEANDYKRMTIEHTDFEGRKDDINKLFKGIDVF